MARLRLRSRDSREARAALAGSASAAVAEVEAALTVPPDPTAGAFFDVDNTVIAGASMYHFARGLAARKFFTSRDLAEFAWQQVKFRVGGRETSTGMASAREAALAFVAGKRVDEIVALGEEIYDELMAERIWSGTRALAELHMEAGQRVWLVTATPVELAAIIARRLGFTGALGTVSEIVDGAYTGRLVGEPLHGPAKAAAVLALADREGLDLERCSAYSDSINDLPMLTSVGRPVAVNPDSALRMEARSRGWEVRDYRTGRKAAKVGVPTALGLGAAGGAVAATLALRRRAGQRRAADDRRAAAGGAVAATLALRRRAGQRRAADDRRATADARGRGRRRGGRPWRRLPGADRLSLVAAGAERGAHRRLPVRVMPR